jgi:hypothetical protein
MKRAGGSISMSDHSRASRIAGRREASREVDERDRLKGVLENGSEIILTTEYRLCSS